MYTIASYVRECYSINKTFACLFGNDRREVSFQLPMELVLIPTYAHTSIFYG